MLMPSARDDAFPDWLIARWRRGVVARAKMELFGQKHLPCYDLTQYAKEKEVFGSETARAKGEKLVGYKDVGLKMRGRSWVV